MIHICPLVVGQPGPGGAKVPLSVYVCPHTEHACALSRTAVLSPLCVLLDIGGTRTWSGMPPMHTRGTEPVLAITNARTLCHVPVSSVPMFHSTQQCPVCGVPATVTWVAYRLPAVPHVCLLKLPPSHLKKSGTWTLEPELWSLAPVGGARGLRSPNSVPCASTSTHEENWTGRAI